jgi:hypothetical protein
MATCCCDPTGDHPGRHRHPALSRVFRSASGVFRSAPDPAQHRRGMLGPTWPTRSPRAGSSAAAAGAAGRGGRSRQDPADRAVRRGSGRARRAGAGRWLCAAGRGGLPFAPVTEALRGLVRDLDPADLEVVAGPARQELGRLLPDLAWGGQAAAADPVSGRGGLECQESSTTEVSPATKSLHKGRAPAFSRYEVYVRIAADDPAAP